MFGKREESDTEELPGGHDNPSSEISAQISDIEKLAASAAAQIDTDHSGDTEKPVLATKESDVDLDRTQYDEDYMVASMLLHWSEQLADMFRRPIWAMKQREAIRLGESTARVLAKYAPQLRMSPEVKLGNDIAAYVMPRMYPQITQEQEPEPENSKDKEADADQGKSKSAE